jgi:hypothetical protein
MYGTKEPEAAQGEKNIKKNTKKNRGWGVREKKIYGKIVRGKIREKGKAGHGLFRSRDFVTSGEKGCACAEHTSGHGLFRSRD